MHIGIVIYDDAEVLDFSGPFEVFSTAKRINALDWNVSLIAASSDTVQARGGYNVLPHYSIHDCPDIDVLIVVGGFHLNVMNDSSLIRWISSAAISAQITASVCTGAFLLAEAKVLTHQTVTTHWEDISDLKQRYPELNVVENQRVVKQGNLYTSGGISAGIDMSLTILATLTTNETATKVARQMEYAWHLEEQLSKR
ncbi:DJ-1/PfpI family protein [Vibrio sp.]|uniref:DJ-1/PfpI family protein n=1 Tax=Vibrio viridaestus TaxID=2487322 RepID=A0A3N9TGT8_9VIBR|nr:DJ-1/PfpI family protein [Vibrio viridaestus]MDC0612470.1 DJ-1/PfpI family protein [Vibrio sp.]RQW63498.1 DJ-1/PfpI family protein [Vibrio viridaestus]